MNHLVVRAASRHDQVSIGSMTVPCAVMVSLRSDALPAPRPLRVVIALDRSLSGQPLRAAVRAAHEVVALLDDGDAVGLVVFHDRAHATRPMVLDAATREQLHAAIDAVRVGDGSALGPALRLAARLARTEHAGDLGHAIVVTGTVADAHRVDLRGLGHDVTFSAVVIDNEASEVEVASMRVLAQHGVLHVGEYDWIGPDLADHLAMRRAIATGTVEVTVQVANGFAHEGTVQPRTEPFALAALAPSAVSSVPFTVELLDPLPPGRTQIALVTVRATTAAGDQLVREQPIIVEATARVGRLDPDVVREELRRDARRALWLTADRYEADVARTLFERVGAMTAAAEAAGLADDRATMDAISLVKRLAAEIARDALQVVSEW